MLFMCFNDLEKVESFLNGGVFMPQKSLGVPFKICLQSQLCVIFICLLLSFEANFVRWPSSQSCYRLVGTGKP